MPQQGIAEVATAATPGAPVALQPGVDYPKRIQRLEAEDPEFTLAESRADRYLLPQREGREVPRHQSGGLERCYWLASRADPPKHWEGKQHEPHHHQRCCVCLRVWRSAARHLPPFPSAQRHLDSDSKEAVRLGMALVGTTLALVLGLLIASGKGFYDTQSSEVTQLAADVVLLDRILSHFGPETKEIRELLRSSVANMVDVTWAQDGSDKTHFAPFAANEGAVFGKIQELSPHSDNQRFLQSQALSMAIQTRPDPIADVRTEVLVCSYAVAGRAGLLAHLAFHELWTIRSSQPDGCGQPIRSLRWRFAQRSS